MHLRICMYASFPLFSFLLLLQKEDQKLIFETNCRLLQVKSIAEYDFKALSSLSLTQCISKYHAVCSIELHFNAWNTTPHTH